MTKKATALPWLYGATIVLLGSTTGGPGFVSIYLFTKKTRSNLSYDYDL